MLKRKYSIVMQTSIGVRDGTMDVQIEKEKVKGYLNVLKRSEPFEGSIDENGNCRIFGTLITLVSIIPYIASGQMTSDSLNLLLESEKTSFPIIGVLLPVKEAAGDNNEFVKERNESIDE